MTTQVKLIIGALVGVVVVLAVVLGITLASGDDTPEASACGNTGTMQMQNMGTSGCSSMGTMQGGNMGSMHDTTMSDFLDDMKKTMTAEDYAAMTEAMLANGIGPSMMTSMMGMMGNSGMGCPAVTPTPTPAP